MRVLHGRLDTLQRITPDLVTRIAPNGSLMKARNLYYSWACNYHELKNQAFHDAETPWDNIQYVPPEEIQYVTYRDSSLDYGHGYLDVGAFDILTRSGQKVDGNWDRQEIEFAELYVHNAIKNRFLNDRDWDETRYFESMASAIDDGEEPWGCTSIDDLWKRCQYIESLFEHIRDNGYKSQRSLGKVPVDEVTVNIGQDGTLFFNDGRHRLSIAKILGLETIPVRILVTHPQFNGNPTVLEHTSSATPSPQQPSVD